MKSTSMWKCSGIGTLHWAAFCTALAAAASMRSTASSGWMEVTPLPRPSLTATVVMAGISSRAKSHSALSPVMSATGTL